MKHNLSKIALMAVVSMAGVGLVSAAEWDKKTIITTDEAMQLPNTMLQPGTLCHQARRLGFQSAHRAVFR